jgi:hypothetical protein
MAKERPVSVLVFAILNIVFGSLGAIGLLCSGLALGLVYGIFSSAGSALPGQSKLHFPPFPSDAMTVSIVQIVIQFLLSIALLFAGIGLLGMKGWARKMCIALSMMGILLALVTPPIAIFCVNPKMEHWQEELQQAIRDQQKTGGQQPPMFYQPQSPALNTIGALITPMLVLAYAIVMLVFMFRPQVSAAFAGRPIRRYKDEDQESEEDIEE